MTKYHQRLLRFTPAGRSDSAPDLAQVYSLHECYHHRVSNHSTLPLSLFPLFGGEAVLLDFLTASASHTFPIVFIPIKLTIYHSHRQFSNYISIEKVWRYITTHFLCFQSLTMQSLSLKFSRFFHGSRLKKLFHVSTKRVTQSQ